MANVQFGGLITGLDTKALINGLVQAESRPIDVLQNQRTLLQARQGVYSALVGALGGFKNAAQGLSLASDFNKRAATSSDSTLLTASADSTAQTGYNTVVVDRLAKAQSVQSVTFAGESDAIGTGTLTLQVGSTAAAITIDGTNNTLTGLRSAINSSGAKVNASIVNVGSSATPDYRLVVQSKDTGIANAVTISGTLSGGADPFAGGAQVVQAAADAVFAVNGLTITRSGNTVSDVLSGVTLVLLREGNHDGAIDASDATGNVTVSADNSAIQDSIQNFIDSYNAVNKIVNDQFTLNPDTKRQGTLAGDASLRGVMSRLRSELSAPGGIGVGLTFLSDIGINFQKDGSLTLDDGTLTKALDSNPTGVSNLFTLVQNGIGKRIPDAVDDFISSVDGALTSRQKGIQDNIDRIDKNIANEQARVTALQDRLTQKFSALEQMVSQLKSQGDFLTQRLAALSGSSK
jgi:flagellar hook-associated protein 2